MQKQVIEDLAAKLSQILPAAPKAIKEEIEASLRTVINASIQKMDLVSREEFEIQSAVLQKTRIKLEQLQSRLEVLEKQVLTPDYQTKAKD